MRVLKQFRLGFGAAFAVVALGAAVACGPAEGEAQLRVVTTQYPINYIAEELTNDNVEVVYLLEGAADPHLFTPTAQDIALVEGADLVLYAAAGDEPWIVDLKSSLPDVKFVAVLEGMDAHDEHGHEEDGDDHAHDEDKEGDDHGHEEDGHDEDGHEEAGHDEDGHEEEGHDEDGHEEEGHDEEGDDHAHEEKGDEHAHEEGDDHAHGAFISHLWSDPFAASAVVPAIRDALIELDATAEAEITAASGSLKASLLAIDGQFHELFSDCTHSVFVTSHGTFTSLAEHQRVMQLSLEDGVPHSDVSGGALASIIDTVRDNNIQYLVDDDEDTANNNAALERIAEATEATILTAEPLIVPPAEGNLLEAITANGQAIARALGCSGV